MVRFGLRPRPHRGHARLRPLRLYSEPSDMCGGRGGKPEGWLAAFRRQPVPPFGAESHGSNQRFETRDPWACGHLREAQSDTQRGSETMSATGREARMIDQPGKSKVFLRGFLAEVNKETPFRRKRSRSELFRRPEIIWFWCYPPGTRRQTAPAVHRPASGGWKAQGRHACELHERGCSPQTFPAQRYLPGR